jgi:hypothetical protein
VGRAFLEELSAFTGLDDPHDDHVDVLAYAALEISRGLPFTPPPLAPSTPSHPGGAVPSG